MLVGSSDRHAGAFVQKLMSGFEAPEERRALQCRNPRRFHGHFHNWRHGLQCTVACKRVRSSDLSHSKPSDYGIIFAQSRLLDTAEEENDDCDSKTS
jgi:hypothetical protein